MLKTTIKITPIIGGWKVESSQEQHDGKIKTIEKTFFKYDKLEEHIGHIVLRDNSYMMINTEREYNIEQNKSYLVN